MMNEDKIERAFRRLCVRRPAPSRQKRFRSWSREAPRRCGRLPNRRFGFQQLPIELNGPDAELALELKRLLQTVKDILEYAHAFFGLLYP